MNRNMGVHNEEVNKSVIFYILLLEIQKVFYASYFGRVKQQTKM